MPASIKILSWNVENLTQEKANTVADVIHTYNPDVFGLYEVVAAPVYDFMIDNFPHHSVFITTGQQSQEILVACRNSFQGIKFQQKAKFKSGNESLRPGAFLSFKHGDHLYGFLFLHTDSGTGPVDFGNRNDMFLHAFNLKRKLDKMAGLSTDFMILGDLNTMGLKYPRKRKADEIANTDKELAFIDQERRRLSRGVNPRMRRLHKPEGTHLSKRYGISDLDHIIAADHLQFLPQTDARVSGQFEVKLGGWRDSPPGPQEEDYAERVSDHCFLFCELVVN
jgi:exonuclease III